MTISRRDFIKASLLGSGASVLPQVAFADDSQDNSDIVICVFQRGAADGLNLVVPYGDSDYYAKRPSLAIPPPDLDNQQAAIKLDGFFGLHPSLSALIPAFEAGDLALVHATGSIDSTHSHFNSQAFVERGALLDADVNSGWLGRYIAETNREGNTVFQSLAMGNAVQPSLHGDVSSIAMTSIDSFDLQAEAGESELLKKVMGDLFSHGEGLSTVADDTLQAISDLDEANPIQYEVNNDAQYPDTIFAQQLLSIGQMIKAGVGVKAACVDIGGWDTHEGEAATLDTLGAEFADSLAAFYLDMSEYMANITVVVLTEFGRRVAENASGGTDHGRGNVAFFLGGGVNGGQVYADWPGLNDAALSGPGDLTPTIDFRTLLAELSEQRLGYTDIDHLFPNFTSAAYLGLFKEK